MRSVTVLAWLAASLVAGFASAWGVIQGPVGDVLPYAAAAGALGLIFKAMRFLDAYQDRIVDGLNAQLTQARVDIEGLKSEHRREIDACNAEHRHDVAELRAAARAAIAERDRYIAELYAEVRDLRRQVGLPDRRSPRPIAPPDLDDLLAPDDEE